MSSSNSIKIWGPSVWKFLHTIVEKIQEDQFQSIHLILFQFVKKIGGLLPCPTCALHASSYLNKINGQTLTTKSQFKMMLFEFHNQVNKNKKLPLFEEKDLEQYQQYSLHDVVQQFINAFHTRHNMAQLNQSFHRRRLIKELVDWLQQNRSIFM